MASYHLRSGSLLLIMAVILIAMPGRAAAFGAGNIPSIAQVEGHNWRHGDIEDTLKTIAFLHGKKWTTLMVQRTYFGNWLRDYSQAIDVGSVKGVNAATIRVLIWVLSFLANGYATEEFEVTEERLGVYRPEEHIDNPLGYADGLDARAFDKRLRGPVLPVETEIDPHTGMKNYIANEQGNWATSAGYLRFSFGRSVHFGRLYSHGSHGKGKEEDLCEALRCLGQALHCMEDFSAHSNYCELALRELGYHEVFPHCGSNSEINLRGKRVFPLVTGTFGGVDFLHSVLGEANDHFTQSEVDQLDIALKNSEQPSGPSGGSGARGFGGGFGAGDFISLVGQLPGVGGGMASEARDLKRMADDQERRNEQQSYSGTRANPNIVPGMSENFDPVKVSKQIYPILEFRDKIVKSINRGISKIPGLESLLEHISETLTAFVLGLLAPFVRPIINAVTKALKDGSSGVISASANSQLEPWKNPHCTDPTHSMLSKDHFTNVLNPCAGRIAATILQYVVPRILYAWDNPGVPVDEVVSDVLRAFHHPALRDERVEIQREMFNTVRKWADEHPRRHDLNRVLGSDSVRNGKNHVLSGQKGHSHGGGIFDGGLMEQLGHGKPSGSLWSQCATRDLNAMGAGETLRPGSGYGSSRPTSSHSQGHPAPSPGYGYSPHQPPQQGYGGQPQHQSYGQQNYPQQGYGAPPQGEAASYYGASQPSQGYPDQGYGAPPPQGYSSYGQRQWGGGYGNPPYH
ncbi:heterokaryon incompatibility Het-C [Daldinia decipiens]|uniref:heterokaryon incompatibility Het-C n=1 Tax=Daldinia decipiens TaxID=326647 RepID=UPI0020C4F267|nr:heterokaryon incompatibility Het-C [Daldinia decipiens]KAI1656296.1 heterokaryon incompatibility Het-C [Daldinia decipiens]